MSAAALSGLEPIAAAAASGGEPIATTAAGERVQQLQTLLALAETGMRANGACLPASVGQSPTLATFASALDAAQAGGASSATAAAYTSATATSPSNLAPASTSGADYASTLLADDYTSATPAAGYTSTTPTALTYNSAAPANANAANGASTYAPLIQQAAARYGLNPSLLYGLIEQESGFDPSATSSAGALGLTQLMPSTAASLGVAEPLNPTQSIEGGARYLSQLLHQFAGNTADALAAYNAGPGAVAQYGGVPPYPETQQYVTKVLGYAASFSQSGQGMGAPALPSTSAAATTTGAVAGAPAIAATAAAATAAGGTSEATV
jgi:soluble lytic murein transglycosylase-like protein